MVAVHQLRCADQPHEDNCPTLHAYRLRFSIEPSQCTLDRRCERDYGVKPAPTAGASDGFLLPATPFHAATGRKCGNVSERKMELMKRVFSSPDRAQLGLLRNILEKAGIPCVERNQQMAQTISVAPFQAELWVEQESDYAEASALLKAWVNPTPAPGAGWSCSRCGELLDGQFEKCWKCGTPRRGAA